MIFQIDIQADRAIDTEDGHIRADPDGIAERHQRGVVPQLRHPEIFAERPLPSAREQFLDLRQPYALIIVVHDPI